MSEPPLRIPCPLSEKCPIAIGTRWEAQHLEWHKRRRVPPFMKIRVAAHSSVNYDALTIINNFSHPINITVRVNERERLRASRRRIPPWGLNGGNLIDVFDPNE